MTKLLERAKELFRSREDPRIKLLQDLNTDLQTQVTGIGALYREQAELSQYYLKILSDYQAIWGGAPPPFGLITPPPQQPRGEYVPEKPERLLPTEALRQRAEAFEKEYAARLEEEWEREQKRLKSSG